MPRDRDRLSAAAESPDYRFILAVARSERLGHRRMITATLRHFATSEFRHPELVANECAVWLDDIRDLCGFRLVITSDARTAEENAGAPGSSASSLHLLGRAFDLEWLVDAAQRWMFLDAVHLASGDRPVELEIVPFGANRHLHVGWFPDAGRASVLIFSEV